MQPRTARLRQPDNSSQGVASYQATGMPTRAVARLIFQVLSKKIGLSSCAYGHGMSITATLYSVFPAPAPCSCSAAARPQFHVEDRQPLRLDQSMANTQPWRLHWLHNNQLHWLMLYSPLPLLDHTLWSLCQFLCVVGVWWSFPARNSARYFGKQKRANVLLLQVHLRIQIWVCISCPSSSTIWYSLSPPLQCVTTWHKRFH